MNRLLDITKRSGFAVLVIASTGLSQSACFLPECDEQTEDYELYKCETTISEIIERLTEIAYGDTDAPPVRANSCPNPLVCFSPECTYADQNGSFERDISGQPTLWYGDKGSQHTRACNDFRSYRFDATSPQGGGPSTSSQIYQIVDYEGIMDGLSPETRQSINRVRAYAAFSIGNTSLEDTDTQFGIRIDAYEGSGYPLSGDPENIPVQSASFDRLATASNSLIFDPDGPEFQPLESVLEIPTGTDFIVVFLEAVENVQNDDTGEFFDSVVDFVRIGLDGGNTPPVANEDLVRVPDDTNVEIDVARNDVDNTSAIDESSVEIVQPPVYGSASVQPDGLVLYAPSAGFVGFDLFTYTVADVEGLRSNESNVSITVFDFNEVPVASDDSYEVPTDGLLVVDSGSGVLANDSDADGDELTALLIEDVQDGTLTLDQSGSFTYQDPGGVVGTTTFTYQASDGELRSNEATVSLTRIAITYDLILTTTADPNSVNNLDEVTFTVEVMNSGPDAASDVEVTYDLTGPETTILFVETSRGAYDADTGLWTVGDIGSGEVVTLQIVALMHLDVTTTATITAGVDQDVDAANNSDDASVDVIG